MLRLLYFKKKEKKGTKRGLCLEKIHIRTYNQRLSQVLGLVTDPMTAGKEDILAQCQKAFTETLGIRPGGPLGHAKTPEEEGMATLSNVMSSAPNGFEMLQTLSLFCRYSFR